MAQPQEHNRTIGYLQGKTEGIELGLAEVRKDLDDHRQEVKQDLKNIHDDLKRDIVDVKDGLNSKITKLDQRIWWVLGILVSSTVLVLLKEFIIAGLAG